MNEPLQLHSYEEALQLLQNHNLSFMPEELHGLLSGFLCIESVQTSDQEWQSFLSDLLNDGLPFPEEALELAQRCAASIRHALKTDSNFSLLLPLEALETTSTEQNQLEKKLEEYVVALSDWLSTFLSALGMRIQPDIARSHHIHTMISELIELSYITMDPDKDTFAQIIALEEITQSIPEAIFVLHEAIRNESNTNEQIFHSSTLH